MLRLLPSPLLNFSRVLEPPLLVFHFANHEPHILEPVELVAKKTNPAAAKPETETEPETVTVKENEKEKETEAIKEEKVEPASEQSKVRASFRPHP